MEKCKKEVSLVTQYEEIMKDGNISFSSDSGIITGKWEKSGDLYKKFSIYDYSKYTTATKASI